MWKPSNFNRVNIQPASPIQQHLDSSSNHVYMSPTTLAVFRTRVCEQHRQGKCLEADRCAHSHCQTWQRRNPREFYYSPRLCPEIEFVRNEKKMSLLRRCSRGRRCMFAHSKEEELYHPNMYKTKMCNAQMCTRFFCPFAHSPKELRLSTAYGLKKTKQDTVPLCKKSHVVNDFKDKWTCEHIVNKHSKESALIFSTHKTSDLTIHKSQQACEARTFDALNTFSSKALKDKTGSGSPTLSSTTASSLPSPNRSLFSSQPSKAQQYHITSQKDQLCLLNPYNMFNNINSPIFKNAPTDVCTNKTFQPASSNTQSIQNAFIFLPNTISSQEDSSPDLTELVFWSHFMPVTYGSPSPSRTLFSCLEFTSIVTHANGEALQEPDLFTLQTNPFEHYLNIGNHSNTHQQPLLPIHQILRATRHQNACSCFPWNTSQHDLQNSSIAVPIKLLADALISSSTLNDCRKCDHLTHDINDSSDKIANNNDENNLILSNSHKTLLCSQSSILSYPFELKSTYSTTQKNLIGNEWTNVYDQYENASLSFNSLKNSSHHPLLTI